MVLSLRQRPKGDPLLVMPLGLLFLAHTRVAADEHEARPARFGLVERLLEEA